MMFCEGIDKVDVLLNPLFFSQDNINRHKDPYHRLALRPAGVFWVLSIQAEWFNPFVDYQAQIAFAVYELAKEGVISFMGTPCTPWMIYLFHECFFLNIVAIEFYSDFKRDNVAIHDAKVFHTIDEAKANDGLYRYYSEKEGQLTETCYSSDKKGARKSQFIAYNRLKKSIRDNNIAPVEELEQKQNPIRCEFKLYSTNTNWLNWDNLRGNYQDIFNRHLGLLAVIYNNQVDGCITVKGQENPNFKRVVKYANRENKTRFKNKRGGDQLKQRETWPDDVLHPEKSMTAEELDDKRAKTVAEVKQGAENKANMAKKSWMDEIGRKVGRNGDGDVQDGL
jgi:hypothetical protein